MISQIDDRLGNKVSVNLLNNNLYSYNINKHTTWPIIQKALIIKRNNLLKNIHYLSKSKLINYLYMTKMLDHFNIYIYILVQIPFFQRARRS